MGGALKVGVALKHVVEIGAIVARIVFDERRRLGDLQQISIDLGSVELLPGNVFQRPAFSRDHGAIITRRTQMLTRSASGEKRLLGRDTITRTVLRCFTGLKVAEYRKNLPRH